MVHAKLYKTLRALSVFWRNRVKCAQSLPCKFNRYYEHQFNKPELASRNDKPGSDSEGNV
jgi:hypothetical protein